MSLEEVDQTRMSFGEHLEELRSCLLRALVGVAITTTLGFVFGDHVLMVLFRPLLMVQAANGLQPNLQALSPTAAFSAFLRIAFLSGLVLAMPWVLHQLWRFVAIGLYAREREFVRKLVWPSTGLFALGVLFQYFVVLPIVLQFFVSFNRAFERPDLTPMAFQSWLLPPALPPGGSSTPIERQKLPVVRGELPKAEVGEMFFHESCGRLLIKTESGWNSVPLERGTAGPVIQSQFALDAYISFVLVLALAFGLAFETPVIVFFLAWTGLVTTSAMSESRRYVILASIIAAAVMTPTPDLINQFLLACPMYLLFEAGLYAAKLSGK